MSYVCLVILILSLIIHFSDENLIEETSNEFEREAVISHRVTVEVENFLRCHLTEGNQINVLINSEFTGLQIWNTIKHINKNIPLFTLCSDTYSHCEKIHNSMRNITLFPREMPGFKGTNVIYVLFTDENSVDDFPVTLKFLNT